MKTIIKVTANIDFTFETKTILGNEYTEASFWVNGKSNASEADPVSIGELKQARKWWAEYIKNNKCLFLAMASDNDDNKRQHKHNYYIKCGFSVCPELNKIIRCGNRILVLDNR